MSILNRLVIKLTCSFKDADCFGNRYYESKKIFSNNCRKRYVIYNGIIEPSKVPPLWHAWLHYMIDDVPKEEIYFWQNTHLPNLTGTKSAYKPKYFSERQVFTTYVKWQPKK